MKCVICFKKAEYLFQGTSFCKKHLIKATPWHDYQQEEEKKKKEG